MKLANFFLVHWYIDFSPVLNKDCLVVNVLCTYPSGAFMLKSRNVCRSITQVLEKLLGLSLRTPSVGCLWLTGVSHSLLFFKQAPRIIQSLINSLTLNLHITLNSSGALAVVHFYSRRQRKTAIRPSTGYLYCQRPATTSIATWVTNIQFLCM